MRTLVLLLSAGVVLGAAARTGLRPRTERAPGAAGVEAIGAFVSPAAASPDTVVAHISGGAIESAFRSLAAAASAADFARDLPTGDLARYQFVVLSRRTAGAVELHERWTDVALVRSGRAVLRTGAALAGRVAKGQGEYSGTAIPVGRERRVGPGDVVVIPAGLAHHWRVEGAAPFQYVVLKVRATARAVQAPRAGGP